MSKLYHRLHISDTCIHVYNGTLPIGYQQIFNGRFLTVHLWTDLILLVNRNLKMRKKRVQLTLRDSVYWMRTLIKNIWNKNLEQQELAINKGITGYYRCGLVGNPSTLVVSAVAVHNCVQIKLPDD